MSRTAAQPSLFDDLKPDMPEGFRYQRDLITAAEEAELLAILADQPFAPFDFNGHLGSRNVLNFGLRYDYGQRKVLETEPIPDWLQPLRSQVAAFAGQPVETFVQVLVNEYGIGAGVHWHRDRPQFGDVVGVSLLSPCPFRFRLKQGERWLRRAMIVEPRSAYLISGPARREWKHSITPVAENRYSITFRTLRKR